MELLPEHRTGCVTVVCLAEHTPGNMFCELFLAEHILRNLFWEGFYKKKAR
jgi:hypothetical protein